MQLPTNTKSNFQTADSSPESVSRLVSQIIRSWPKDRPINARQILSQHPQIQQCKSAVLDLAYEEFCQLAESKCEIPSIEFARQFPQIQSSLFRLLEVHRFVEQNPDVSEAIREFPWPQIGETFLGFSLKTEIGRGAFSRVFLANEVGLGGRLIVLKVCPQPDREAHALGKLSHPNVVPVFSVVSDEVSGMSAICLPYLGRATLLDVIDAAFSNEKSITSDHIIQDVVDGMNREEPPELPVANDAVSPWVGAYSDKVVTIAAQLAEALTFIHRKGVFHGDIKPSNVLVTGDGRACLFDFNLALHGKDTFHNIGGTIPYMAPELLHLLLDEKNDCENTVNAQTDVFSLGASLYQLLTGELPFGSGPNDLGNRASLDAWLIRHQEELRPVRELNPQVDDQLARIIHRCLAFDPSKRPQSAGELSSQLQAILSQKSKLESSSKQSALRAVLYLVSATAVSVLLWAFSIFGNNSSPTFNEVIGDDGSIPQPMPSEQTSKFADKQLRAGFAALASKDALLAWKHFGNAISANPKRPEAFFGRGLCHIKLEKLEPALQDFMKAEELFQDAPVDGRVFACQGYCVAQLAGDIKPPKAAIGKYREAIQLFSQAIQTSAASSEISLDIPVIYSNIGFCRSQIFRNKMKGRNSGSVAENQPMSVQDHINAINREQTQFQHAHRLPEFGAVRKALNAFPDSGTLYYYSAKIYLQAAAYASARSPNDTDMHIQQFLACAWTGVRVGLQPNRLQNIKPSEPLLRGNAEFQALIASAGAELQLLDPLKLSSKPITFRTGTLSASP